MAKNEKNAPAAEPETEKSTDEKAAPPPKSGNMKLIIIVVVAMLIGGVGAFGALKVLGGGSSAPVEETTEEVTEETETEEAIEAPKRDGEEKDAPKKGKDDAEEKGEGKEGEEEVFMPQNIELKPFVANLGSSGGRKFLKLTMSVEVDTLELSDEVNQKMPQFRDTILLLLSSLSYDDIATLDGKQRLRNQVLNRINSQLSTGKVKNIYFSEFVMQ